jgi:uncharacterized protein (DUF362 family)
MGKIPGIDGFVNIETLFVGEHERNITSLVKSYEQLELLKEKIRKISEGILDNNQIISGKKIMLKPNWVTHNRKENDEICLRTNDNFILALVQIILDCKPAIITIGDAPIQGCNWDKMLSPDFYKNIEELSVRHSIPIIIKDFRRVTFDPNKNIPIEERNPISDFIIFDLGKESYLEPISSTKSRFRVTNYNPERLKESHTIGKHKYCITKELFDADVVISVPKIKTHQKAGITGALKNLVGVNGDKDFLPHHRIGGQGFGGDCYPGKNLFRRISEFFLDCANRKQGKNTYWLWIYLSKIMWKLSFPKEVHHLAAGWYGNDTTWRMVMDINIIAVFGKKDGTISKIPQRTLYSLCDGIIGGQGDGPLNPQPLPLGVISFANNSSMTDICMGTLMGFDIRKIPLLKTAKQIIEQKKIILTLNGKQIILKDLANLSIQTLPPPGWVDYLKPE